MTILYSHDYEDDTLKATASGVPPVVSNTFALAGTKSMRCRIALNNPPGAYRSEITSLLLNSIDRHFTNNESYWLGFAVYIPANHSTDTHDIIFQMQDSPDAAELGRSAPLQLFIQDDQWGFRGFADSNAITENNAYTGYAEHSQLATVQYGSWHRVVLNFKIDWSNSGFCKVWINDEQVLNHSGPLFYNDTQGPYVRFGLNRPAWKDIANWEANSGYTQDELYFDAIKIGDSLESYTSVSPLGTALPSPSGLQSVNGNNQIAPNTAVNTVVGVGLSGVISASISDYDTLEEVQALGFPNGTNAVFNSGPLTNIDTPAFVDLDIAEGAVFDVNPMVWGDNCEDAVLLESAYATVYGPFSSGRTLVINQALNWARSVFSTGITVSPGDVIDAEFYFAPGTGNQGLFGLNVGGGSYNMDYAGTLSSPLTNTATTAGTGQSFTIVASTIYPGLYIGKLSFISNVSGLVSLGMGPRSMTLGHSIHELGVKVWKNRIVKTKTIMVDIPSKYHTIYGSPVISTVSTTRQNEQSTVTLTNALSVVKAQLTSSDNTVDLRDFRVSVTETGIEFTIPRNVATGDNTLTLTHAPVTYWSKTPSLWYDTVGGVLGRGQAIETWLGDTGVNVFSGGQEWHALTEGLLLAQPGETVTVELFYKLGTSGRLGFGVLHSLSTGGVLYAGKPYAMDNIAGDFGANYRLAEDEINGVRRVSLTFDNHESGYIYLIAGPNSIRTGSDIALLAVRAWSHRGLSTVTQTVNVLASLSDITKRIRFAQNYSNEGVDNRIKRGTTFYTGVIDRLSIYNNWPLGYTGEPNIPSLASTQNVQITDGVLDLTDVDFTDGSLDSLQDGDIVTAAGWNVDRSLFFIRQLKVVVS